MKRITDQPGRYLAVFVLCPLFIMIAYILKSHCAYNEHIATFLTIFSIIFIIYESFWIMNYPSKRVCF